MKKDRLLIVGGTGFIGRHLCLEAQRRGYAVTSLSLTGTADPAPGIRYLKGDMARIGFTAELSDGLDFEYVINAGGYINHSGFWSGGQQIMDALFGGVGHLIAACNRDVLKKFIQIGSSDEYGSAHAPQREDVREEAISPYSLARVASVHLLQTLWRSERFPAAVARLFLVYGPGQGEQRFLPQLISGCLQNKRFPVSAGAQLRDFCHVDDVVKGILAMLEPPAICGEVINIASGAGISIAEMIERVCKLVGAGEPLFGQVPYRTGESMALYADIAKAQSLLEWKPRISLDEGLQATIDWYRRKLNAQ